MNERRKSPKLKSWTKKGITKADWDFSELFTWIEEEMASSPSWLACTIPARAYLWELDRELGSGNRAFALSEKMNALDGTDTPESNVLHLMRPGNQVTHVTIDVPPWVKASSRLPLQFQTWPIGKLAQHVTHDTVSALRGGCVIYALEIPILENDNALVAAFCKFLRQIRNIHKPRHKAAGRKREWRTWFANLAAYRLFACGYSRRDSLSRTGQKLSAPNFARAKRHAKRQIMSRFEELKTKAANLSRQFPEKFSPDWRNYFVKPGCQKSSSDS